MRLSKNIKAAILNAAIAKSGIKDREAAIRSRYAAWAEAVRVLALPAELEDAMLRLINEAKPIIKKNPNFSITDGESHCIYTNVAGQSRKIYFNGCVDKDELTKSVYKRVAYYQTPIAGGHPLANELFEIDHDAAALKSEREQLTLSLQAVLDSVTTDTQLIKVWPEAVAFIPATERASSPQLPALPIADLNRMLGLP